LRDSYDPDFHETQGINNLPSYFAGKQAKVTVLGVQIAHKDSKSVGSFSGIQKVIDYLR